MIRIGFIDLDLALDSRSGARWDHLAMVRGLEGLANHEIRAEATVAP